MALPTPQVVHTLREGGTLSTIQTYRTLESALAADPHGLVTDSDVAAQTSVETPLDTVLLQEIRARRARRVVLCGNAGDGTAEDQRMSHAAASAVWVLDPHG